MIAIKNWFLEKNGLNGIHGVDLTIVAETNKAVRCSYKINNRLYNDWFPKSVIIEEWEKDTSDFGYHKYLVEKVNEHFGYNQFRHQMTNEDLKRWLDSENVQYYNKKQWKER